MFQAPYSATRVTKGNPNPRKEWIVQDANGYILGEWFSTQAKAEKAAKSRNKN
jgi:hypothetical protein